MSSRMAGTIIWSVPFKENVGFIIGGLIFTFLGTHAGLRLFTLVDNGPRLDFRRLGTLLFAAFSLSLGSWSCQLMNGRISLWPVQSTQPTFLQFNPGFVALALFAPWLILCGTFMLLRWSRLMMCCKCVLGGLAMASSVACMRFLLLKSTPLAVHYDSVRLSLSLFLDLLGSIIACGSVVFLKHRWSNCSCFQIAVPSVFSALTSGASALALNGTTFSFKQNIQFGAHAKRYWDVVTLVIPSIAATALACVVVCLLFKDWKENRTRCPISPTPRLTIASIAFASDGRVLVDDRGLLPMQEIDLTGLDNNIMNNLKTHCDTFHWLYSLSFDWSIFIPLLSPIAQKQIKNVGIEGWLRTAFHLSPTSLRRPTTAPMMSPQSVLKKRLLEAVVGLAADLDIPVTKIGHLYDRTLTTGSHLGIAEFLVLSQHQATQMRLRDAEKSGGSYNPDDHTGLMLFLVRDLPRVPISPDDDWVRKYATKGYRLQFMRRFRDALADAMNASQHAVDKMLLGCRRYVQNGTRPILDPGATYVSLFAERMNENGVQEVLVYDFAKHQIPSYRLDIKSFTPEMLTWVRSMGAMNISAERFVEICNEDVELDDECILMHRLSTLLVDSFGESTLYDFKKALAQSLELLYSELSFVERLPSNARLSPLVIDVPSSGECPAHLIVFKVELKSVEEDVLSVGGRQARSEPAQASNESHSSSSCRTATPAAFSYTPRALYEVCQSLMFGQTGDFKRRQFEELQALCRSDSTGVGGSPISGRAALVSTFSLDSICDVECISAGNKPDSMLTRAKSRLRVGLSKTSNAKKESMFIPLRKDKPDLISPSETFDAEVPVLPILRSQLVLAHHPPVRLLCSYPPSRQSMDVKFPTSNHPYLEPRMPSPVVLSSTRFHRHSSSIISLVETDSYDATDETVTNTS